MKKFIVAIAALAMMTGSAWAADWNFYGSSRVSTFVTDTDNPGAAYDPQDFAAAQQGNSRIGANVKVSDELTGRFEYGTGVNVRILYGEWNFGAGKFLVGQTYTPLNLFTSNQVFGADNGLLAQGGVYGGRQPMLRLSFGGFQIAATNTTTAAVSGLGNIENDFPAIEAKYSTKIDAVSLAVAGGYQSFSETNAADTLSYDIDAYVVALQAGVDLGPAWIKGNIYTGQNAGYLMGVSTDGDNGWGDGTAGFANAAIQDNDAFGFVIAGGYAINDMFKLEAGYGYVETELDNAAEEDECAAYYLNATVVLAPGVFFVPEVGVFDGKTNGAGADDIETTYYGVKWQINF